MPRSTKALSPENARPTLIFEAERVDLSLNSPLGGLVIALGCDMDPVPFRFL